LGGKRLKTYKVKITEISEMEVEITADSPADARVLAEDGYNSKNYVLDASNLKQGCISRRFITPTAITKRKGLSTTCGRLRVC